MASLPFQIVVQSGVVIGVYPPTTDLYPLFPVDNTVQYFDYAGLPIGYVVTASEITTVSPPQGILPVFNDGLVDPGTGIDPTTQDPTTFIPDVQTVSGQVLAPLDLPPDPRLAMSLANAKLAVISNINKIAASKILTLYSIEKQILITNAMTDPSSGSAFNGTDLSNMKTAINAVNATVATEITAVNALGSVNACIAYNPFF